MDFEAISWLIGGFGSVCVLLLSAIVYLIYTDRNESKEEFKELRTWVTTQQREIHDLTTYTNVAVELIKQEQKMNHERFEEERNTNNERLRIFEENFFKLKRK